MIESSQPAARLSIQSDFADDPDFREILEMFAEAIPEKQRDLQSSCRDGDIEQLRISAHQLKGAGGGYGFPDLTKLSAALEDACKADDFSRIDETFDELLDYLDRITV